MPDHGAVPLHRTQLVIVILCVGRAKLHWNIRPGTFPPLVKRVSEDWSVNGSAVSGALVTFDSSNTSRAPFQVSRPVQLQGLILAPGASHPTASSQRHQGLLPHYAWCTPNKGNGIFYMRARSYLYPVPSVSRPRFRRLNDTSIHCSHFVIRFYTHPRHLLRVCLGSKVPFRPHSTAACDSFS